MDYANALGIAWDDDIVADTDPVFLVSEPDFEDDSFEDNEFIEDVAIHDEFGFEPDFEDLI